MAKVAALAGRRIDPIGATEVRFPLRRAELVQKEIRYLLVEEEIETLICSAACGADLLALGAASDLGIQFQIILPFEAAAFRKTSVTDRPGSWGPIYDQLIEHSRSNGCLTTLDGKIGSQSAYKLANEAIISAAQTIAGGAQVLAIFVWDGKPRQDSDATAEFRNLALAAGMKERSIPTCSR